MGSHRRTGRLGWGAPACGHKCWGNLHGSKSTPLAAGGVSHGHSGTLTPGVVQVTQALCSTPGVGGGTIWPWLQPLSLTEMCCHLCPESLALEGTDICPLRAAAPSTELRAPVFPVGEVNPIPTAHHVP